MLKYITVTALLITSVYQFKGVQTLHSEIERMTLVECNSCHPKAKRSIIQNYFSIMDSLEKQGANYTQRDKEIRLQLENYIKQKSALEFRPFISNLTKNDSTTRFELDIGHFQKITDGYVYLQGIKTLYNSDQCLPEKYDSISAVWINNITGQRKSITYP